MRETLYDWCVKNNKKELLKDWDCVKNNSNNLFVDKVSYGSGIRVSWKCRFCGYEWESKINNRTINNRNCPSCTIKTTSFGEQTLYYYVKKLYPDAINRYRNWGIELDIYIPSKSWV